jgi:hypothetical protein
MSSFREPPRVDGTLSGTSFDFRARIELGGFDPRLSAAAAGVARAAEYAGLVDNGHHRVSVLSESFDIAKALLRHPANDIDLDRASVLLAHCERVLRSGARALGGGTGRLLDNATDGTAFADPTMFSARSRTTRSRWSGSWPRA